MKISVIIITLNEIANIERCVKSLGFADEVLVVDSGSSDDTVKVAQGLGANVISNEFEGFGQQKNFAMSKAKNDWIFFIDADEEVSGDLRESINKAVACKTDKILYSMPRLTQYCDKWIYHGGWYPSQVKRLCRKGDAIWSTPNVHEDLIPNSDVIVLPLKGDILHYSFPSLISQVETNTKWARRGAIDLKNKLGRRPYMLEVLVRPKIKFVECYFIKRGFMDGVRGFFIALNAAHSQFMKYATAYLNRD